MPVMQERKLAAPMTPALKDPFDTSYFDEFEELEGGGMNGPDKNATHWEGLWEWCVYSICCLLAALQGCLALHLAWLRL